MIYLAGVLTFLGVAILAWVVFRRVQRDYQTMGKLSSLSTILEITIFFVHGSSAYIFLDSSLSHMRTEEAWFWAAIVLMGVGLVLVAISMSRLGWGVSIGQNVDGLRTSGLYRYSRNPQLVAYTLVVLGYALLWPSLTGLMWVMLYVVIAQMMVRVEEEHLRRTFGEAYREYAERTPRYIGLVRR